MQLPQACRGSALILGEAILPVSCQHWKRRPHELGLSVYKYISNVQLRNMWHVKSHLTQESKCHIRSEVENQENPSLPANVPSHSQASCGSILILTEAAVPVALQRWKTWPHELELGWKGFQLSGREKSRKATLHWMQYSKTAPQTSNFMHTANSKTRKANHCLPAIVPSLLGFMFESNRSSQTRCLAMLEDRATWVRTWPEKGVSTEWLRNWKWYSD